MSSYALFVINFPNPADPYRLSRADHRVQRSVNARVCEGIGDPPNLAISATSARSVRWTVPTTTHREAPKTPDQHHPIM